MDAAEFLFYLTDRDIVGLLYLIDFRKISGQALTDKKFSQVRSIIRDSFLS